MTDKPEKPVSTIRRLLIVDDEQDLRETLSQMCFELTPDIKTASDGLEALELIRQGQFDAVLSDINMPRMTGLQLLAEVRAAGLDLPFVILTGHGDKTIVTEALRLGATDFVEKPFDIDQLLSVIDYALDLGLGLREIEKEFDALYQDKSLPADRIINIKKARRAISMMKKNLDVYNKNKKSS